MLSKLEALVLVVALMVSAAIVITVVVVGPK